MLTFFRWEICNRFVYILKSLTACLKTKIAVSGVHSSPKETQL